MANKKSKKAKKEKKKKRSVAIIENSIAEFKDGSHGTHLEQEAKMKHEDFPLFLRLGFEEAGERINK